MADEDNLLSIIPLVQTVFHDREGTSRLFDPAAYNLISYHQEMLDYDLLYRHVDRRSWLLLKVHRLGKIVSYATNLPVVPDGRFISQHAAVNWLLDRGKPVPKDIDISDRMEVPPDFVMTAEPEAAGFDAPSDTARKPKLVRNLTWYVWYHDKAAATHRSPAAIRDRWNRENPKDQINLEASDGGRGLVKQGIQAAKKYLDSRGIEALAAIDEFTAVRLTSRRFSLNY